MGGQKLYITSFNAPNYKASWNWCGNVVKLTPKTLPIAHNIVGADIFYSICDTIYNSKVFQQFLQVAIAKLEEKTIAWLLALL